MPHFFGITIRTMQYLKSGSEVIRGHWRCSHAVDCILFLVCVLQ